MTSTAMRRFETAGRLPLAGRAPDWPAWIKPHLVVMIAIFAGALAVGYMILPGVNERIAALERDGKNRDALKLLEQLFQRGDRSPRTLFQLQNLYEHFGELDEARRTLEMLAALRPRDAQVQRRLAQLYKLTHNEAGYMEAMRRQLATRYSEPVCKELIGIYRRSGDYATEQAMISECRQRGYRRPDDVIRLAYLVAADGRLAEASDLLKSVDDRRRLKVDRDRLMFFTALLEAGEADEAQKRALRWLKGSKDDSFVLLLIDNLAKENRHDLAIDLARAVGTPGDGVSLAVAELMLVRDQIVAARAYLKGWLDTARIRDADVARRFVAAALDAEDPELAFRGGEAFGLARIGQDHLVALAEALSAVGQVAAFQKVRAEIDPATLSDNPLLAAAIEADRGAREPARQLLSRVQVDSLDEWRLALWAKLMESTGRSSTPAQALREIGVEQPPAVVPTQPRIIRRFKAPPQARPPRLTTARKARPAAPAAPPQPPPQPPPPAFKSFPTPGG